jgi:hypothetical protein
MSKSGHKNGQADLAIGKLRERQNQEEMRVSPQ